MKVWVTHTPHKKFMRHTKMSLSLIKTLLKWEKKRNRKKKNKFFLTCMREAAWGDRYFHFTKDAEAVMTWCETGHTTAGWSGEMWHTSLCLKAPALTSLTALNIVSILRTLNSGQKARFVFCIKPLLYTHFLVAKSSIWGYSALYPDVVLPLSL